MELHSILLVVVRIEFWIWVLIWYIDWVLLIRKLVLFTKTQLLHHVFFILCPLVWAVAVLSVNIIWFLEVGLAGCLEIVQVEFYVKWDFRWTYLRPIHDGGSSTFLDTENANWVWNFCFDRLLSFFQYLRSWNHWFSFDLLQTISKFPLLIVQFQKLFSWPKFSFSFVSPLASSFFWSILFHETYGPHH